MLIGCDVPCGLLDPSSLLWGQPDVTKGSRATVHRAVLGHLAGMFLTVTLASGSLLMWLYVYFAGSCEFRPWEGSEFTRHAGMLTCWFQMILKSERDLVWGLDCNGSLTVLSPSQVSGPASGP